MPILQFLLDSPTVHSFRFCAYSQHMRIRVWINCLILNQSMSRKVNSYNKLVFWNIWKNQRIVRSEFKAVWYHRPIFHISYVSCEKDYNFKSHFRFDEGLSISNEFILAHPTLDVPWYFPKEFSSKTSPLLFTKMI